MLLCGRRDFTFFNQFFVGLFGGKLFGGFDGVFDSSFSWFAVDEGLHLIFAPAGVDFAFVEHLDDFERYFVFLLLSPVYQFALVVPLLMRQAFDIQMQLDYAVDNNLAREVEAFLKVDGSYERFEGIAVDGFEDALLFAVVLLLISKEGYNVFSRGKLSFAWAKDFFRIGSVSGLESFVRNTAYILMVSRMVNLVGEQGTYWVANNFIWGWLLLPVIQLGELIKQETAADEKAVKTNTPGYFAITALSCAVWVILIPVYKPFMQYVLGFSDVDKLFELVMVLLGFYVLYAFQNVFDCTFYGRGKTGYMLFESVVTNTLYYGTFFALYLAGVWTPSLIGIALMFGFGNAFDTVVSGLAYLHFRRKLNQSEEVADSE